MKYIIISIFLIFSSHPFHEKGRQKVTLSKAQLYDKIKGGWIGQFIGVTYASGMNASASLEKRPDESFKWSEGYQLSVFRGSPDLYDDIYVDLTFLEAIQEYGTGITTRKLSEAYVKATYSMNHACQSARYNLMKGKNPQRSGYWLDNPHADDNDFQIHADFIGLMNPGLPQSAALLSDKVGHLMSYGDGYYGGLYVATLNSLAFTISDPQQLVLKSLESIPEKSSFYKCVSYAIEQHRQFPYAWDRALGQFQRKWGTGFGCPDRLTGKEDVDAKMNAAYVTLALLYGQSDFEKSLQIVRAMRQADSNAATVAGILGVMYGFEKIPQDFKQNIDEIETLQFPNSTLSLADACDITFREAMKAIENNKGNASRDGVIIFSQNPLAHKLEKSFEGHYPKEVRSMGDTVLANRIDFDFEGIGFVLHGSAPDQQSDEIVLAELYMNNKFIEVIEIPLKTNNRRPELLWKFQLPHDNYRVSIRPLQKDLKFGVKLTDLVVYDVTAN